MPKTKKKTSEGDPAETRDLREEYAAQLLEKIDEEEEDEQSRHEAEDQAKGSEYDQQIKIASGGYSSSFLYLLALLIAGFVDATSWGLLGVDLNTALIVKVAGIVIIAILLGKKALSVVILLGAISIALSYFGLGYLPVLFIGFLILWAQASPAHRAVAEIRRRKREYEQKIARGKSNRSGNKYREPQPWWTLILILAALVVIALVYFGKLDPTSTFTLALGGTILSLWVFSAITGYPWRPGWNQDTAIFLAKFILIVVIIGTFIMLILPALYGCILSGECQALLNEGVLQGQIEFGQIPNPFTWYKGVLQKSGFQLEGQAETAKVGVRISAMGTRLPRGGVYHEGDPVTVYVNLVSTLYYPTLVQHNCVLSTASKPIGQADEINPETTDLFETKEQTVSCTWNDLKKGSYRATYTGTLYSITNAIVPLTFVERQTMESFRTHEPETNLNTFLYINPVFKPLFTNGPINVQFDRITQPIPVTLGEPRVVPINIFVESNWSDGQVEHIDSFTLYLPTEIELVKKEGCQDFDIQDASIQNYKAYVFPYEKIGNPRSAFRQLSCQLIIQSPEKLLLDKPKVVKTIAAEIKYKYKIKKETTFSVRK